MKYIIILFSITLMSFLIMSCNKEEIKEENPPVEYRYGTVLFYTNAQIATNCGAFDVDVYIDSIKIGVLNYAYLSTWPIPPCEIEDTMKFVKVQKKEGVYNSYAIFRCSPNGRISYHTLNIVCDSCTRIYLDINDAQPINN